MIFHSCFPWLLYESWASMPLCLSCLAPWSGNHDIFHCWSIDWLNRITTYSTISAWSTSICPVFPTFIGSPLWCSQISDHHFCLMTLLQTCQICHSDNSSAKFQPLLSFHAQSGTSMSTLGFHTYLYPIIQTATVMLQANFPWKITFNTLYTNRFLIRICSRTLSIILRT